MDILTTLQSYPKDILHLIIFELVRSGHLEIQKLSEMQCKYIEELRRGATEKYLELQGKVIEAFHSPKKDYDKNIKGIMHYLLDEGRINTTHEKIDKR